MASYQKERVKTFLSITHFIIIIITSVGFYTKLKNISLVLCVLSCLSIIVYCFCLEIRKCEIKVRGDIVALLLLSLVISLSFFTGLYDINFDRDGFFYLFRSFLPILVYFSVRYIYTKESDRFYVITLIFSLLIILHFGYQDSLKAFEQEGYLKQVNWSNIALSMTPFIFLSKSKFTKILGLSLVFLIVMISLKRSGYAVLLLALIIYFLFLIYLSFKERKIYYLIPVFSFPIFSVFLYTYFSDFEYVYRAIERIEQLRVDGGSGRDLIWWDTLSFWYNASIERKVLGYSFTSYGEISNYRYAAAHNDFLDILLNYGIVGLLLFVFFLFRALLIGVLVIIKNKNGLVSFSIFTIANTLVYVMAAGIYHFSQLFLVLFAAFAVLEVRANKEKYLKLKL